MIEPTIGRIVLYKCMDGETRPAMIVAVWTPDMVNLKVILDDSNDYRTGRGFTMHECVNGLAWRTSVKRGEGKGEWDWMPYQKGQAAKTEELEKALEETKG